MERIERHAMFGGWQEVWQHSSTSLNCSVNFAVYLPPQAAEKKCPVLYWLSGLTCNEQNFITKANAQRYAAEHGVIIIAPDTSPRGEHVANDDAYDLGQGAGFYINATQAPWSAHYRMYDYIVEELPTLIEQHFPATAQRGITGHSMGGHGALMIALRNPKRYASVSAFAPIVAPTQVPWGKKAFNAYLGNESTSWEMYDTVALIAQAKEQLHLLIDQGTDDSFLKEQLRTELLEQACQHTNHPYTIRYQQGYDHSYYFIATFIEDHIKHHAQAMNSEQ